MSLQAYQTAQRVTENPRMTEYRLFAQVTKALLDAREGGTAERARAIDWNRRLWLALQSDCATDANALPVDLRAGIISLAIWVDKHSRQALRREADLQPLIDVNRSIMEGLLGIDMPQHASREPAELAVAGY